MKVNSLRAGLKRRFIRWVVLITCAVPLVIGGTSLFAQTAQEPNQQDVSIPPDQLDSLVAPIALFPDEMLSQTLVASTYPLELMQLQQWLDKNKGLKDKALVDAVSKQPWDPSVQAMAALPDLVKRLTDDIQWTTDLGNAFLAQQSDVMNAIQRMRVKAEEKGALKSDEHQKVETQVIQDKSVVVIEQANPEVVYVPSYDPVAVYGAPAYPYPAISYPAYYPGTLAAGAISFGVGMAMGAAWGGGWGWGAGWGGNDIDMNFNNSFNRNANVNRANVAGNRGAGNKWQHNAQHRGGAPYSNRATANKFGGTTRGASTANRQKAAQQSINRQKGNLGSTANRGAGTRSAGANRAAGANRSAGANRAAGTNRGGGGVSGASRGGSTGMSGGRSTGGADRAGNRSVGSSSGNRGGFGGGSGGYSGSSARSSRSRGSSSMRSSGGRSGGGRSGGGGRSRGGGGGGGGRSRGGGGGGRRR